MLMELSNEHMEKYIQENGNPSCWLPDIVRKKNTAISVYYATNNWNWGTIPLQETNYLNNTTK
jgi:hypothetical protein